MNALLPWHSVCFNFFSLLHAQAAEVKGCSEGVGEVGGKELHKREERNKSKSSITGLLLQFPQGVCETCLQIVGMVSRGYMLGSVMTNMFLTSIMF